MHIVLLLILYFEVIFNILVQSNLQEGDIHGDMRVITYRSANGYNILVLVTLPAHLIQYLFVQMFVRPLEIV